MWWRWRSVMYLQAVTARELQYRAQRRGDDEIMAFTGGALLIAFPLAVLELVTLAWWVLTGRQPPFLGFGRYAPVHPFTKPDGEPLRQATARVRANPPPGVLMRTPGAAPPRPTPGGAD